MSLGNFKTKYDRLKYELEMTGKGDMKCFGSSMTPKLPNASTCSYEVRSEYFIGDIVFAKVNGRWVDSHLITGKKSEKGTIMYLISNNHGHDNGWTSKVYGKVVSSVDSSGKITTFKDNN